jgi:inorganic pyrophosphatase
MFRAHPWHGVPIGDQAPEIVTVYIELTPADTVKYEMDKSTGLLKVDRPQRFSNVCPTLYGFVPQTYCAEASGAYCAKRIGRSGIMGDGDPLDICVLAEKPIAMNNILLRARPIGGLRLIDGKEADDKIIGVMDGDAAFGALQRIEQCPLALIERLRHYFLTYKQSPDAIGKTCEITDVYGCEEAREVILKAREDYLVHFRAYAEAVDRPS